MIYHSKADPNQGDSYSLDDLDREARHTCADLRLHLGEFDVIAVTGLSGVLPGVPASLRLKVPLAILRKPDDNTHQYGGKRYTADGSCWVGANSITDGTRVLWLDDFSCSGDTEKRVTLAVEELGGKVVAHYLTQHRDYVPVGS